MDNAVIAKLHTNKPLTTADIAELEKILWSEVGTKEDYQQEYKPRHSSRFGDLLFGQNIDIE